MAGSKLDDLLSNLDTDQATDHLAVALEALTIIKRAPLHRPEVVVELVPEVEYSVSSSERLSLLEQLGLASAELGDWEKYEESLGRLSEEVGKKANGLARLRGAGLESRGRYDEAVTNEYETVAQSGSNSGVWRGNDRVRAGWRRAIACFKSKLMWGHAMAMLGYYLTVFATDIVAWVELGSLCLARAKISQALFCACECLCLQPDDYKFYNWTADIYYTLGGLEHFVKARAYYAASLTLKKNGNLRALYGLWLTTNAIKTLSEFGKAGTKLSEKNNSLLKWASESLKLTYRDSSNSHIVNKMLENGIS